MFHFFTWRFYNEKTCVHFLYKNSGEKGAPGIIQGQLNTSNHSPYKGTIGYRLPSVFFVLPANLSDSALVAIAKGGIGYNTNENGVMIGTLGANADAGNHYSYRLMCRSDKR